MFPGFFKNPGLTDSIATTFARYKELEAAKLSNLGRLLVWPIF